MEHQPVMVRMYLAALICACGLIILISISALCLGATFCPNGGTCTAPNICVCTAGWSGTRCTSGTKSNFTKLLLWMKRYVARYMTSHNWAWAVCKGSSFYFRREVTLSFESIFGGREPWIFKVNKPAIQADRIFCLCKLIAHSLFRKSSTVHCP